MRKRFAVVIGRRVQLFRRPSSTQHKVYREPISWLVKNCKNKAEALKIADNWTTYGKL